MSSDKLLQSAYESIQNDDLVAAMEYAKEILNENTENAYGLEVMGYLMLELNCHEEAKFCFTKSIENGNESHAPFLYLGELSTGEESATNFLKAAEVMKNYLNNKDEGVRMFKPSQLDVSNCYVSLSEIYMTDLCDNDDAEERCSLYCNMAVKEDEANPASWQALASFNLIKNDKDACKVNISKSLSIWLPAAKLLMDNSNDTEIVATCDLSPELRVKCAEILFELEMFDDMKFVLESILIEDEESMQAHYLMASMLELQMKPEVEENSKESIEILLAHADAAISLSDEEIEKYAVEKMQAIIDKYDNCIDDIEDRAESDDSDDDVME